MLAPRAPWPQDDGGRVALWQDLLAVASRFETHLVVMHAGQGPPPVVPAVLAERGMQVSFVVHRTPAMPVALLQGALGRWPYTLARFHSAAFERALRAIVTSWQPDLVFINNLHMATYVDAFDGCAKVLRQHNLEYRWLQRYADSSHNPAVAAYAGLQAHRMRRTEAELCARMDMVLAIQDDEADAMRVLAPGVRVEAVPVGAQFADEPRRPPAGTPSLLIVGSFDREPNSEGVLRFLNEGWPLVRARIPGARLRIVGRGIPARLSQLALELGAEPMGFVENLGAEFAQASGMVVPLWFGAGVRVKSIEAIAAGLPLVCTPLGAESLHLEPGRHYLEGVTAAELGMAAVELLLNPERAARLAAEAHASLRERFGSEAVTRRTVELCEAALIGKVRGK